MRPCLFGFDVNSHFARNYSMHTKDGEPSGPNTHDNDGNPIYSLRPTLQSVLKEMRAVNALGIQHTHMVAVFDHPGKNFRHDIFPDYKGNRPPRPSSWTSQEARLVGFFQSNGIPCLQQEWVEADDVLATLATTLSERGVDSVLFTGDKDIMSLCGPNIRVYSGREKKLYEEKDVEERFEVPCHRVLDYLTMLGDLTDNVSGIEGIGSKTATKVASQVSLQELLENPHQVLTTLKVRGANKISDWIINNKDKVLLSQKLIALKTDIKLGANMKEFKYSSPQR